jgi:uncharacterized metal-binding protein
MQQANCGCGGMKPLIYACSGKADVGALADVIARRLTQQGTGMMHCLAGIGGQVPEVLAVTHKAGTILAIDGCPLDCARHSLEREGIQNVIHLRLTDHGYTKGQTQCSEENIATAMELAAGMLKPAAVEQG